MAGYTPGRKPLSSEPWSSESYGETTNDEERIARNKLFYFSVLIFFVFGVLTLQLARMQLVNGEEYRQRAENNRLRQVPIMPARGLIYDRNGVPLVENAPSFAAAVVPADIPSGQELRIGIALQEVTGVPAGETVARIEERRRSNDPFTPAIIKEGLSDEAAFSLREMLAALPGVRVVIEPQRRYFEGELLSHVLGFVGPIYAEDYDRLAPAGYQLNDRVGRAGIEVTYENFLRGALGTKAVETDASGREIQVLGETPATPGHNLVLSIDVEMQRKVEEFVRAGMGASANAAAIVVNVKTGEILSLVSLPNYNSNAFSGDIDEAALASYSVDPAKPMLNHAISEMYPPGSTFKLITGLGALQDGVATANTQIFSPGYLEIPNPYLPGTADRFRDWRGDLGTMNFYRGIAMSSNVYFYYLSGGYESSTQSFRGLGATRLAQWARNFGLGEASGIDLPGESEGLVPDPQWKQQTIGESWLLGDTYNYGIGQGYVSATPIQVLMVTAAIANGGNLLVPHLVKELRDGNGNQIALSRDHLKRNLGIDQRNLAVMREAMRQAVADGSASSAAAKGVAVAGKTGTAEFDERRPDGSYKEHGWFTGFGPFENPEIALVVFLERGSGGGTAAPVASRIFDWYFNQRNVAQGQAR
jgi:penicillin-binding protein 2